jgi:two-component system sensor histidine kinase TorS
LFNLIGNSIKFTVKGKVELVISSKFTSVWTNNEHEIKFKVVDTGIGIKARDIPKLFELFGNLKQKDGINQNGIGLGLTISKKLTE